MSHNLKDSLAQAVVVDTAAAVAAAMAMADSVSILRRPPAFASSPSLICVCCPTPIVLLLVGGGKGKGGGGGLGAGLREVRDWDMSKLPAFEKNFYYEHPDVTKRPEEEATAWRNSHDISIAGDGIPKPCLTFEEASMPSYVQDEVVKCGFKGPTPIQAQGWPMALMGRDMIGISKTGSGKTLAFLLPAMIHINAQVSVH
jgi:hypothetical protein